MNFKFYNEAEINYDIEKSWQTKQSNNPKAFFGFSDFHNNYKLYFYPFQITYENFMTMDSWYSEEMKKISNG
jgi:muramoyltetrapeptide carboxypeptidase LdcA involved in peptidoglycan recycling